MLVSVRRESLVSLTLRKRFSGFRVSERGIALVRRESRDDGRTFDAAGGEDDALAVSNGFHADDFRVDETVRTKGVAVLQIVRFLKTISR